MLWYSIVLLVFVLGNLVLWKGVALVLAKFPSLLMDTGSVIDLIMDYWKVFLVTVLIALGLGTYTVSYQLHEMYTCAVRSNVNKVETQYSWYFDKCQFINKNGVFVDFDKVRGTPGEEEHE